MILESVDFDAFFFGVDDPVFLDTVFFVGSIFRLQVEVAGGRGENLDDQVGGAVDFVFG